MKKLLLGLVAVQAVAVVYGLLMYLGISELVILERQTFVIMINVKIVLLVALYIAWRITPFSKVAVKTGGEKD
ncbi:MAG: hypothetical protein EXS51_03420 [Candidatus Taylorbacteria bacterium]|nr:hypothetical protein [Candidatus Taylorbacteria bacterium]